MKRYFQYIALACLAFALNSCIKDEFVDNSFCRDSQLTLNLSLGDLTRADDEPDPSDDNGVVGDDKISLNENKITRVEIYLYPTGSESSDAKFAYAQDIIANDKVEDLKCTVPAGALSDLFGSSGTSCSAYVVVNYKNETVFDTDNAVKTLTGTSITTLKKRVVETDFTETTTIEVGWVPKKVIDPQDSFVMDSDIATITKTDNALSGTVYVTRAAAKITFTASIPAKLKVDGVEWTPQMEKLTVAFKNIATNSLVDNGSDTSATTDDLNFPADNPAVYAGVSGIQLSYEAVDGDAPGFEGDNDVEGVEGGWLVANIVVPFYTYSNFWTEKANNEPAITLSVPWYVAGKESTTLTTYTYTVPFNIDATTKQGKFVRNKHYQYNLRVGVLGDLVVLGTYEFSYVVLDWIGENTINVELQKPTYLVVEKDYVEVFNENSYSVNYSSSDSITAEIVSIIKPDYSAEVPQEYEYIYGDKDSDSGLATVDGSGFSGNTEDFMVIYDEDKITLSHTLDNVMSSTGFDYVPYTVKVKVTMQAGTKTYIEYITFKQYPAIYIYADTNASFVSTESSNADNNNPANTFVNGWNRPGGSETIAPGVTIINNQNPTKAGTVYGYYGSSNHNPNQYVITVSSLDSSLPYIIADPRSRTSDVSSLNIGTIATSYAVDYDFNLTSEQHQLQYYYPTNYARTDGSTTLSEDAKDYVTGYHIAPKYRIASSYSVTSGVNTLQIARQRCATYQENGYPAGRWRMPTYAEVAFISLMSHRQIIPRLFDEGKSYWCAHGQFVPDDEGNVNLGGSGSISIRCVYDEWYWGSKRLSTDTNDTPNYAQFVWGDMKIW
nr:hypothetical protein [Alistipes sp.]